MTPLQVVGISEEYINDVNRHMFVLIQVSRWLPEEYREAYVNNVVDQGKVEQVIAWLKLQKHADYFREFISGSFTWCRTPQGHDYWSDLNMKLFRGTIELDYNANQTQAVSRKVKL